MKRERRHGHVCLFLALACTSVAAVANNITIAGDYTAIVLSAVATALAALILVGVGGLSTSAPPFANGRMVVTAVEEDC